MYRQVCIVGSGNWGSAIARLVGFNAARLPERFQKEVTGQNSRSFHIFIYIMLQVAMWVFEEEVNGRKLTEIINTDHENVKYLPGRKLPENVVAVPDISVAAADADFLIFVLPHQFIGRACAPLKGKLKPEAQGLSLVKGFAIQPGGGIKLISELITAEMGLPVSVLMGANLANEVGSSTMSCQLILCERWQTRNSARRRLGQRIRRWGQTSSFSSRLTTSGEIDQWI